MQASDYTILTFLLLAKSSFLSCHLIPRLKVRRLHQIYSPATKPRFPLEEFFDQPNKPTNISFLFLVRSCCHWLSSHQIISILAAAAKSHSFHLLLSLTNALKMLTGSSDHSLILATRRQNMSPPPSFRFCTSCNTNGCHCS